MMIHHENPCSDTTGLLLIRGLGHSGSTLLDLSLGAHPQVMGVGEAIRVMETPNPADLASVPAQLRDQRRKKRFCTCGLPVDHCKLWGPLLADIRHLQRISNESKMNALINQALAIVGNSGLKWVVESYQSDKALLSELCAKQSAKRPVKVIFLVRDIRSWVHSQLKRRHGGYPKIFLTQRAAFRWWRENRHLDKLLHRKKFDFFILGYEELALAPEAALSKITRWLGISYDPEMLHLSRYSSSHIIEGNRMRFDSTRNSSIQYDGSWLRSSSCLLNVLPMMPGIRKMNSRLVYGNDLIGVRDPHQLKTRCDGDKE
jgi:hypothetical protein